MSATAPRTGASVPGPAARAPLGGRRRSAVTIASIGASAILFALAWQAVVLVGDYPPFILPGPLVVLERFATAWGDGTMWPHARTTLVEILLGFAVGGSAGLLVGLLLARSRLAERLLSPYLVAAQATPILALAPLIALWFGTGLLGKVVICSLIVLFPVAVATMVGIRSVDRRLVEMARSFRATRPQLVVAIEIPAALPAILGGMRVGVTLAVVGAIIGEWAGGERGLGVLINLARGSLFDIPLLFATLMTIGLVGIALYLSMVALERVLVGVR